MYEIMEFDGDKLVPNGQRPLDPTRIDWHSLPHSGSSMRRVGVCPLDATRKQVEAAVMGTFGGRFESFGNGKFVYIAYTD